MATKLPNYLTTEYISHARKVCKLYKQACRYTEANNKRILTKCRVQCVLIRHEFDKNKNLGPEQAKVCLEKGEATVWKNKPNWPMQFATSPGGISYGRYDPHPDSLLDYWHPLEKAQFPKYFAVRDIRKREKRERYEKEFGPPPPEGPA